jgi:aryl-alcohol dehydrogenase-like predicted oxidoreductase
MEYRLLGTTGVRVSELCLGTMQFGWTASEAESCEVLSAAHSAGINFIDTADIYSRWADGNPGGVSESIIGKWLGRKEARREQLVIATKARGDMGQGPNDQGLSRLHVQASVEGSLRRLGTDYIDLYQLHWPDEDTPIEETLRALDDLVHKGSIRYIGCSNFPAWRLVQALWISDRQQLVAFATLQPHYSLMHRAEYERELEAVSQAYRLGVLPYSPLAGGFLTGKYRRGAAAPSPSRGESSQRIQGYMQRESSWDLLDALEKIARARGKAISQAALAWLLSRPTVTCPIIGPRNVGQLNDNLGAVGLRLDGAEMDILDRISAWE